MIQNETVMLGHGSGGSMMKRIIDEVFFAAYGTAELLRGDDAAVLPAPAPGERIAFSTDSFVVTPHFFPGGDIGKLFPDTDPAYKGADSIALLQEVGRVLARAGWAAGNIDATLLCQAPKLAPYIPAMRENLAAALGISAEDVSVKATTEEKLGFTGSGEGIAAHSVCLLRRI